MTALTGQQSAADREPASPNDATALERRTWWLFLAVVVVKALSYWIGSFILRPDDPLSTIVMYRGKDIESFPIMKNLGEWQFGEPGLFEGNNEGVLTERYIPWALHAFLFAIMGPVGFIVADLIVTPLRYVLVAHLFGLCGIGRVAAAATAAVLTCIAIGDFGEVLPHVFGEPIRFWGLRLPRPYISEMFLLMAMIGGIKALNDLHERGQPPRWAWAVAGGGLALLAQSDFYSAIGLGLAFLGVFAWELIRSTSAQRAALARGAIIALMTALVITVPGMIQSARTNPEAIIRLGLFEVSRFRPPFIAAPTWYAAVAALAALSWFLSRGRAGGDGVRQSRQHGARVLFVATCAGALVAMPFMSVVTGKAIELYHFRDSFVRYLSLAMVVVGLHLGAAIWRLVSGRRPALASTGVQHWVAVLPAGAVCAVLAWRFATVHPRQSAHMRADYPEWAALTNYRQPFVELTRELSKPRYDAFPVLGTFDHQVWSWWLTFRDGYSYLADACTTNATAAELERRAAELAGVIGMTRAEFETFVRRHYVMIFWMSCAKYQGSSAYSFSPLSDYTAEDQRRIVSTPNYLNFTVALPLSQQQRLGELFDSLDPRARRRLDMVIVTRDSSVAGFAPSSLEFDLAFENALFRVWTRRHR